MSFTVVAARGVFVAQPAQIGDYIFMILPISHRRPKQKTIAPRTMVLQSSGAQIRTEDLRVMSSNLDSVHFHEQFLQLSVISGFRCKRARRVVVWMWIGE